MCGSALVAVPGYSKWCRECGWNIDPLSGEQRPMSRAERVLAGLGERASESLQREFSSISGLRPRLTLAKLLAIALSVPVHLLTVALAIVGVLLIVSGNLIFFVGGALALLTAWVLHPRVPSYSGPAEPIELIPALTRVAGEIAHAVGTRAPDRIVVSSDFNAAVMASGWRRTRILLVGLPLFAVLGPQERAALLAHEFGHFANGDPRRLFVVEAALNSLLAWYMLLVPEGLFHSDSEDVPGVLMFPINLLMLAVSAIPLGAARLLVTLIYRETQRGEYLADAIAARVAGTDALVSGWGKLHLGRVFATVASSSSEEHWKNGNLWDEMQLRAAQLPESEFERAQMLDRATSARFDITHPPTTSRIEAVRSRGSLESSLQLSEEDSAAIDSELRTFEPRTREQLVEAHRDSISGPSREDMLRAYE